MTSSHSLKVFPLREGGAYHSCLQARGGAMTQTFQCVFVFVMDHQDFQADSQVLEDTNHISPGERSHLTIWKMRCR